MVKDEIFERLIHQLRSVEIDGEIFFVVEGDLLMTEDELRAVSEKQLRFFVACQRAIEISQQEHERDRQDSSSDSEKGPAQDLL